MIHVFNIFRNEYKIPFQGHKHNSSFLGFLLTLFTFTIGIIFLVLEGKEIFVRSNPVIKLNTEYDLIPKRQNLTTLPMFSFYFYGAKKDQFFNESYFTISVESLVQERKEDNSIVRTKTSLGWEKCKLNSSNLEEFNKYENFTEVLNSLDYSNHICLKNRSLEVGGSYNSDFFSNIYISLKVCNNNTSKVPCVRKEDMQSTILNENFGIFYLESIININNYNGKPFTPFIDNYWIKLDLTIYNQIDLYFTERRIYDDKGVF